MDQLALFISRPIVPILPSYFEPLPCIGVVGLAIGFASPTFAQEKNAVDPQLRRQLDAFLKKHDEAWNNNDASALAALFTDDGIEVTDTGPIYGREALEKNWVDLFKHIHMSNHISTVDQYSPHNGRATAQRSTFVTPMPGRSGWST